MGGIVGGLIGGVVQGRAASKAASAQTAAADRNIAYQEQTRDLIRADVAPFLDAGNDASAALRYELFGGERPVFGANALSVESFQEANPAYANAEAQRRRNFLNADGSDKDQYRPYLNALSGSAPQNVTRFRVGDSVFDSQDEAQAYAQANSTGGTPYQGYQQSAGYQHQFDQGIAAIDASAASQGGLYSGATGRSQQTFGHGIAAQDRGRYLDRLTQQAASGQNAAALSATNYAQTASNVGNSLAGIGNAQAAGAIGQGNAFAGALNNLGGAFANAQAKGQGLGDRQTWFGF